MTDPALATDRPPRQALGRILHVLARGPGARSFMSVHARLLRLTRGRFPQRWFGAKVILLETTGRRTGRVRRSAIVGVARRDGWIVTTANGGLHRRPSWAYNLDSTEHATVYDAGRCCHVRRRIPAGDAARALWQDYLRQVPAVVQFQKTADRPFDIYFLEQVPDE